MSVNKLTEAAQSEKAAMPLTNKNHVRFRISIEHDLCNSYAFKDLKPSSLSEFHHFLSETVGKELTITQVDTLFLRTKGKVKTKETVCGIERDIVHYGKNRTRFRIHGYYNEHRYFVIWKIDPNHDVHK